MKRYRTAHWRRLREDVRDRAPGFAKHLRDIARPHQIAFQQVMASCGGNPAGVECKHVSGKGWAFILPDAHGQSSWRIQHFDADGFIGHTGHKSLVEATEAMIAEGYRVIDPGALDRSAATLRWAIGVKREELRLLFNQGKIEWKEMLDRMQQVGKSIRRAAAIRRLASMSGREGVI